MCMAFNVQWNGARQITFPEEPPRWKQESSAGGRLWEGWSVIKGCRLGIAWQSRWAAGRTWELRNDSESGKPFSKIKPVTGSKWRHQKRRVSALEVRNLHLQLWHLLIRLVHQLSQHHLLPITFQISGMQTCRHHNYLPVGVGGVVKTQITWPQARVSASGGLRFWFARLPSLQELCCWKHTLRTSVILYLQSLFCLVFPSPAWSHL